ncbi:MAG: 50S ribosomal protein L10, partial [Desulfurococcaceae archaeon]
MSQRAEVRKTRRSYPERKSKFYGRIQELAGRYSVIAVSSLHKVRARQLSEIRRKLRGNVIMIGAKNKLAMKAMREAGVRGIDDLEGYFKEQSMLIFTDMNPFELQSVLEKSKVDMPARAGDVASSDIVVPSGNTGLQPGPVLSSFKQFKIPTRIESGSIFISSDTVVARP